MHEWLIADHAPNDYAMAGFVLKNTLSDNGGVTRGVCQVADDGRHIIDVVETSNIVKVFGNADSKNDVGTDDDAATSPKDTLGISAEADGVAIDPESYVSMNFWGFPGNPPAFLKVLDEGFVEFFKNTVPTNPLKSEYLLPIMIGGMLRAGECTLEVLPTSDTWYGMTYKEDVAAVTASFGEMIRDGKYKDDLYSDL